MYDEISFCCFNHQHNMCRSLHKSFIISDQTPMQVYSDTSNNTCWCYTIMSAFNELPNYQITVTRIRHDKNQGDVVIEDIIFPHQISWNLSLLLSYLSVAQWFCNFAQSMAMILPCSVQNFKAIEQVKCMLWLNKILQDSCLPWVS